MRTITLWLNLNMDAISELEKVVDFNFNVFRLKQTTDDNELVALLPYLCAKRGLLGHTNLDVNKSINFIREI